MTPPHEDPAAAVREACEGPCNDTKLMCIAGILRGDIGMESFDCEGLAEDMDALRAALERLRGLRVDALDDLIGLHESIEVQRVVDGYEADFIIHDGATVHRTARGSTALGAVLALLLSLEGS